MLHKSYICQWTVQAWHCTCTGGRTGAAPSTTTSSSTGRSASTPGAWSPAISGIYLSLFLFFVNYLFIFFIYLSIHIIPIYLSSLSIFLTIPLSLSYYLFISLPIYLLTNERSEEEDVLISDLSPATRYILQLTAHNSAGNRWGSSHLVRLLIWENIVILQFLWLVLDGSGLVDLTE